MVISNPCELSSYAAISPAAPAPITITFCCCMNLTSGIRSTSSDPLASPGEGEAVKAALLQCHTSVVPPTTATVPMPLLNFQCLTNSKHISSALLYNLEQLNGQV